MDMVQRRTFILFIPRVQALSDLCEALISSDALFLQDGGLHYHLEVAFLVGEKEGGERRIGEGGEGGERRIGEGRQGEENRGGRRGREGREEREREKREREESAREKREREESARRGRGRGKTGK